MLNVNNTQQSSSHEDQCVQALQNRINYCKSKTKFSELNLSKCFAHLNKITPTLIKQVNSLFKEELLQDSLSHIRAINLANNNLNWQIIESLFHDVKLPERITDINLSQNKIGKCAHLNELNRLDLTSFANVNNLNLSENYISKTDGERVIKAVENMPQLQSLNLSHNDMFYDEKTAKKSLIHLKHLATIVATKTIDLKNLDLSLNRSSQYTDECLKVLVNLNSLTYLNISKNDIDIREIPKLAKICENLPQVGFNLGNSALNQFFQLCQNEKSENRDNIKPKIIDIVFKTVKEDSEDTIEILQYFLQEKHDQYQISGNVTDDNGVTLLEACPNSEVRQFLLQCEDMSTHTYSISEESTLTTSEPIYVVWEPQLTGTTNEQT